MRSSLLSFDSCPETVYSRAYLTRAKKNLLFRGVVLAHLLEGSWELISGVFSTLRKVVSMVTLLKTLLISTHEAPSRLAIFLPDLKRGVETGLLKLHANLGNLKAQTRHSQNPNSPGTLHLRNQLYNPTPRNVLSFRKISGVGGLRALGPWRLKFLGLGCFRAVGSLPLRLQRTLQSERSQTLNVYLILLQLGWVAGWRGGYRPRA